MLPLLAILLVFTINYALGYSTTQYRHLKCRISVLSRDAPRIDVNRYTAVNSRSKYNAALRVSLDQSVLPKSRLSFRLGWIMVVAVAVVVSIFRVVRRDEDTSYSDISSPNDGAAAGSLDEISTIFKSVFSVDVLAPIKNVASWLRDSTRRQLQSKKTKLLSLDIWNVCRLANIEKLGDQYSRYRFDVTSYPDCVVPLDIGQEVCINADIP